MIIITLTIVSHHRGYHHGHHLHHNHLYQTRPVGQIVAYSSFVQVIVSRRGQLQVPVGQDDQVVERA